MIYFYFLLNVHMMQHLLYQIVQHASQNWSQPRVLISHSHIGTQNDDTANYKEKQVF